MAVEAQFLRDRGIFEYVISTMLKGLEVYFLEGLSPHMEGIIHLGSAKVFFTPEILKGTSPCLFTDGPVPAFGPQHHQGWGLYSCSHVPGTTGLPLFDLDLCAGRLPCGFPCLPPHPRDSVGFEFGSLGLLEAIRDSPLSTLSQGCNSCYPSTLQGKCLSL